MKCDLALFSLICSNPLFKDTFVCVFVQGVDKHEVLRRVLPAIGSDLKFQRLYTEYKDQLDLAESS